jgi:CBS domain-containing protein
MRTEVTTVGVDTRTVDAIQLMRRYRYGCLPVLQDGHLVGILTEEDFMNVALKLLETELGETAR